MFQTPFKDRRRRRRQLLNTSVQIFMRSTHVHALGINVSEVGMCLFTVAHLPVGSEISIEFRPPQCNEPVRVDATVRHRALYLYGIEFLAGSDHRADSPSFGSELEACNFNTLE
jgi:hypothetical protein